MLVLTIRVPLLLALLSAGFVLGDGAGLNLPHREYGLDPVRRAVMFAYLCKQGERFAIRVASFKAYSHWLGCSRTARAPRTRRAER